MTGGAEEPTPPTLEDDPGGSAERDPGRGDPRDTAPGTTVMMTQDAGKELPRNMMEARRRPDVEQWESALDREIQRNVAHGVHVVVRISDIPKETDGTIEVFKSYQRIGSSSKENPQHARLRRSLYGLADAGLQWYNTLNTQLQDYGMVRSADDLGLFTLREDSKVMVLVIVWVDDVLLCGDPRYTKELLDHLEMQFPMRHYSNPTELHLTVTRGILRYLRGSVDCSLSYGVTDRTDQLMAFYDANYAGDRTGAKSTSAFVILLNGAAVTYSSKLQTVVAQSTTEAEVIALAECTRAVIALRGKLEAMGLRQPPETVINVDSQTAIHLAHRHQGASTTPCDSSS
jgi:hypothetical protein